MCEILVFWFWDSVWWKAAMLSIIGTLRLRDHIPLVSGKLQIPNQQVLVLFDWFKSMHANQDCNLRWVVANGSVSDDLISHSAQQKNCPKNSVRVSWQRVSIQHFPILMQSLGAPPGVEQPNKVSTDKTKGNQILFFCLWLISYTLFCILYLITETKWYTYWLWLIFRVFCC